MSDALLALWIALIGADRIDLAGGHGPFVVTPFLALLPAVMISEVLRRLRSGRRIEVPYGLLQYAAVAAALVSVVMASVLVAPELPTAGSRAMLLVMDVFGTLVVALLCLDRPGLGRTLARGAVWALPTFMMFDLAEMASWIGRGSELLRIGPMTMSFGALQNAGPLPRLAGPVADANRGGFVLLFYLSLILLGRRPSGWRTFLLSGATLLLLATFSRSATLGAVGLVLMILLSSQRAPSAGAMLAGACAVALAAAFAMVEPRLVDQLASAYNSPAASRLSVNEGSAQGHLALLERGLNEATASVPRALIGLGFGNSYFVLQDVFPGNRYGNFHSLYVSMFAESGVFALVLTVVLLAVPLVRGGPWQPFVVAAIAFNAFYQTPTEPSFWFALALAWAGHAQRRRSEA